MLRYGARHEIHEIALSELARGHIDREPVKTNAPRCQQFVSSAGLVENPPA